MALRLKYFVAILLIGWMALTAAYLPPDGKPAFRYRDDYTLRDHAFALSWYANRAKDVLSLLRQRDRVRAATVRSTGRPVVWVDPALAEETADRVRRMVARQWPATAPGAPDVPVTVAVVVDTVDSRGTRVDYFLPRQAGETCMALVRLGKEAVKASVWFPVQHRTGLHATMSRWITQDVIGPCAFYGAFGMPGPAIGSWLTSGAARFASAGAVPQPAIRSMHGFDFGWYREVDYERMSLLVAGCFRGHDANCANGILHPDRYSGDRPAAGVVSSEATSFGIAGQGWMGDLARDKGLGAFGAFWHSTQPVDSAFASAFGTSIGPWTAAWLRMRTGEAAPRPSAGDVAISLLAVIGLVGVGAAFSWRRQVA